MDCFNGYTKIFKAELNFLQPTSCIDIKAPVVMDNAASIVSNWTWPFMQLTVLCID